jgi:two-component sensor histidine kinase
MTGDKNGNDDSLEAANASLRELLTQAGIDAARLLTQAGIDATENEAAKRLQRLLVEELHHRVKNTLATVMAITSQTLRTADTLESGRLAVESRLAALGRAHDLLLRVRWSNARLTDVIHAAIEPFAGEVGGRFVVADAPIEIGASAVLPIAMSLNELCTNAIKHGALSNRDGRVEIGAAVDEGVQRFRLTWIETGGPTVRAPGRSGFGTRLINRISQQLHGSVRSRYEPGGLIWELDAPMEALRPMVQTDAKIAVTAQP